MEQAFDLNIGEVLEHWQVAFAIRELIANALDEHVITGTAEPQIVKDGRGDWHIRDFGRGIRYEHLTQNENPEKHQHQDVIGKFGVGLKDALAVFDRNQIIVNIRSGHGDITTGMRAKSGFPDVITLHALVTPPADPHLAGTDICLSGVSDDDVAIAKGFFLRYSGDTPLEQTRLGDVLTRRAGADEARIYVKGLMVATEPNFLFSYNITRLSAELERALNRERSNVGRGAYSAQVKKILTACRSSQVAGPLTDDLGQYTSGTMHDELSWRDVALHACRVLQTNEKVVFITPWIQHGDNQALRHAIDDGYRPVVVPDDIARSLGSTTDLDGRPMIDLEAYRQEFNDSLVFVIVDPAELNPVERAVFDMTSPIVSLAKTNLRGTGIDIVISETMRLDEGGQPILGLWDPQERRVILRRDLLHNLDRYAGILLRELGRALTGTFDETSEFEEELTRLLGVVAAAGLTHTRA
ncbi:hypothetical protein ABH926_008832 [Catenulispora sp. GP43]|uniref:ATP-binding protein n=1 Tax=Catenulispora sp. GP43 TaxID=3156263 RepID=UPI00351587D6